MIKLLIKNRNDVPISEFTYKQASISIGRNPDNTVVIDELNISAYQAQINKQGDRYLITDLASANGTYINGIKLSALTPKLLVDGDEIAVGNFKLNLKIDFRESYKKTLSDRDKISNSEISKRLRPIALKGRDRVNIGRDPNNEITIDHPMVSRYHSCIFKENGSFYIVDLDSTNGIYINGKQVKEKRVLKTGDIVQIGPCNFSFNINETLVQQNQVGDLRLDAISLNKKVAKGLNLLNNISISIPERKFTVIAGVSGGGKSTLLNALNGSSPATSGKVLVNGVDLYRHFNAYRTEIGYVPQKDIVHLELSVVEALSYAARLRMPADTSPGEISQRVETVMEDLGLSHRQKVPVKSLSGGQLKRVSIGVELLTRPSLFFLDEATSGLDPGTEEDLMQLLRQLADSGCTIILITHATDNVMLCDLVLFMAKGGYLAYFGPPKQISNYFGVDKFNKIYHLVERERSPEVWQQQYLQSSYYHEYVEKAQISIRQSSQSTQNPSFGKQPFSRTKIKQGSSWRQFLILSQRNLAILIRDRASLFLMLAIAPILGILDIFTWQSKLFDANAGDVGQAITMLFTTSLIAVMIGSLATMREIVKEKDIYRRERTVGLQILPYIFSKLWVGILLALYQAGIFLLFRLIAIDIPRTPDVIVGFYITLVLTTLAGAVMGLLVSTISPNQNIAPLLTIVFLVPQITFGGGVLPANNFGAVGQFLNQITLTKWSFESLVTITAIGKDVAADPCWRLSETERKNLTKKERTLCTCWGQNLFALCNFPEIKSKYDPAVDLPEPQKPEAPGDLPAPPNPPVNNSVSAQQKYQTDLDNYQKTIEQYQEKVSTYQEDMDLWQEKYTDWKEKSQAAIGEAEAIINTYQESYGNAFNVNLLKSWSIIIISIGVMLGLIIILQKQKDMI